MADSEIPKPDPFANIPPEDLEIVRAQVEANLDEADKDLTLVLGLKSLGMEQDFIDEAIDLASQMLAQGLPEKAFKYCVGLVQYEPLDYRIYQLMGVIQHTLKRHSLALALYHAAIGVNEKDGLSHLYAGECLLHLERRDEGFAELRTGIDLLKRDPSKAMYVKRGENVLAIQTTASQAPATPAGGAPAKK